MFGWEYLSGFYGVVVSVRQASLYGIGIEFLPVVTKLSTFSRSMLSFFIFFNSYCYAYSIFSFSASTIASNFLGLVCNSDSQCIFGIEGSNGTNSVFIPLLLAGICFRYAQEIYP